MNKKKKYSVVSLFAGCGGLDLGFELENFKTIWANDIDKDSCLTYANWSKATIVHGDITKMDYSEIPDAEIILGGFPCQGFSLAGPRKVDDSRNKLYRHFVELVEQRKPLAFVAENVKGLLTLGEGKIIEAIINDFSNKGYIVKYKLLNVADFGVPQDRFRVIMVGIRKDLPYNFEFPQPKKRSSLKNALSKFPEPKKEDICMAPYSSRYLSRNRRREWDTVSFTIPAMAKQVPLHPSSPSMIKIHSDLWKFGNKEKTRRFSWREAAAIQTFPSNLYFEGKLESKYKQIGNAVPVQFARAIAKELYSALNKSI